MTYHYFLKFAKKSDMPFNIWFSEYLPLSNSSIKLTITEPTTHPSENLFKLRICFLFLIPNPTQMGRLEIFLIFSKDFLTSSIEGFFVPVMPITET